MTFLAVSVVCLLICASLGLARGERSLNPLIPAFIAAVMVCAQFALLVTR